MSDLTTKEQENTRAALRFLRARLGSDGFAKALRSDRSTLRAVLRGGSVSASLAVRTARLAGVSVDALFAGEFPPPGTCPHCGHRDESAV
jgi:hypothetical protein